MTEQQHPITPPPELVEEWIAQVWHEGTPVRVGASDIHIATQAARWGADQELYECLQLLDINGCPSKWIDMLRDARRRPKPPSLAEQALAELDQIPTHDNEGRTVGGDVSIIRAALERLQELESNG